MNYDQLTIQNWTDQIAKDLQDPKATIMWWSTDYRK